MICKYLYESIGVRIDRLKCGDCKVCAGISEEILWHYARIAYSLEHFREHILERLLLSYSEALIRTEMHLPENFIFHRDIRASLVGKTTEEKKAIIDSLVATGLYGGDLYTIAEDNLEE